MKRMQRRLLLCVIGEIAASQAMAHGSALETVSVIGRQTNLVGQAVSASEGVVGQGEIAIRPLLRTGEVLELVPGLVVTQHSGTGKANQYFLRGFNLDHGTDFATYIDGMPVNMRTHGHGQGYTDLNFLIPETVGQLAYKKGAYYADVGDFSGAGSAEISTTNAVENGLIQATVGEDSFSRTVLLNSFETDSGDTLFALEHNRADGPWTDIDEDLEKTNVLLKHTVPLNDGQISVAFMAYDNHWNSADQIPERAVNQGLIDELGSIDTTVGGESSRYSLNTQWQSGHWQGSAYIIESDLNLWSNFTLFLEDEINGDQFEQVDDRTIYGGRLSYFFDGNFFDYPMSNRFGAELRVDDIDEVGLYKTRARQRLGTVRNDRVKESSLSAFWENRIAWSDSLRSIISVRHDYYDFDVSDQVGINTNNVDLNANSGSTDDNLTSVKANVVYTFSNQWESYLSAGQGFHSNDARGTTIQVDPSSGSDVDSVDPLVRSVGYELGIRGFITDKINTSLAFWSLDLDSELLFVGDAGNTEASRGSERQGVELTAYYSINDTWSVDLEYAYTDSKFSGSAAEGNEIPGAIDNVLQAGINANLSDGWFGSLRLRYFGERPLTEDGSVSSDASTLVNLRMGYDAKNWSVKADILNLTDSNDHDIDYYYESRLANETSGEGTEDIHFHVLEPRTVRVSAAYKF